MKWILLAATSLACASAPRHGVLVAPIDTTGAIVLGPLTDSTGIARSDGSPPAAYFEFQVERVAKIIDSGSPRGPIYPHDLRIAGVEGDVVAQWIVDELGRPEMSSFRVLRSPHEKFSRSVRDFVALQRFEPAQLHGRNVRQLVQQPFGFRVGL